MNAGTGQSDVVVVQRTRWPHRLALLLAVVVFPLIWMGGLVTTWDAGMAVPDWPGTYGYNMFAYPVYDWLFGPFDLKIEHGHRLLGSLAGLVAIGLVVVTWWRGCSARLRWFALALLLMVIIQGVLGGVRVLRDNRTIAQIHGCFGPAFFAAVAAFTAMTSRWWAGWAGREPLLVRGGFLTTMGWLLLGGSFVQLVLGSFLRHLPEAARTTTFAHLVWLHVAGAITVFAMSLIEVAAVWRGRLGGAGIRGPVTLAALLVGLQTGLGVATWIMRYGWPAWMDRWEFAAAWTIPERTYLQSNLVTLHVATGSLILAAWAVVIVRLSRLSGGRTVRAGGGGLAGSVSPRTAVQ